MLIPADYGIVVIDILRRRGLNMASDLSSSPIPPHRQTRYPFGVPAIQDAVELLRQGHLVAFPTETVYGLGADATNPAAIELIYHTKGRPSTNPLIIHVASIAMAQRLAAAWPDAAQRLADQFWPGPLTLVLSKRLPDSTAIHPPSDQPPTAPALHIPDIATANLPTVALRVPNHPLALALLRAFDGPLAAPSANRSTHISPTTAQHVRDEFPMSLAVTRRTKQPLSPSPHLPTAPSPLHEPSLVLDGGPCNVGIESTVLDLTDAAHPTILRPGHISASEIAAVLGQDVYLHSSTTPTDAPASSPGQHEIHYAPRAPAYRFSTAQRGLIQPETPAGEKNGLVVLSPLIIKGGVKKWEYIVAMSRDPAAYAQHIYEVLREIDAMEPAAIFIEMPPDEPEWTAIRDRLRRATRDLPI